MVIRGMTDAPLSSNDQKKPVHWWQTFGRLGLAVAGPASVQAASLLMMLAAAAVLGPADYGVYALALVWVEAVVVLTHTGYAQFAVVTPFEDGPHRALSTLFWIFLALGILGGGLLFCAAPLLARVFDSPALAELLQVLAVLQPGTAVMAWAGAVVVRSGRMTRYFAGQAAINLSALAVGLAALALWPSLVALLVYRAARVAFGLGILLPLAGLRPALLLDHALVRRATRFSLGLYAGRGVQFLSQFGGDLALAYLFSTAESGLYRFANRLAGATLDLAGQPIRTLALARLGRAARDGQPLTAVFCRMFCALLIATAGLGLLVGLIGPPMITALFPAAYAAALPVCLVLLARGVFTTGTALVDPVFSAGHRTYVSAWYHIGLGVVGLFAVVTAAPLGLVPMALAQTGVALAGSGVALWLIHRYGQVDVRPALTRVISLVGLTGPPLGILWLVLSGRHLAGLPPLGWAALIAALGVLLGVAVLRLPRVWAR